MMYWLHSAVCTVCITRECNLGCIFQREINFGLTRAQFLTLQPVLDRHWLCIKEFMQVVNSENMCQFFIIIYHTVMFFILKCGGIIPLDEW